MCSAFYCISRRAGPANQGLNFCNVATLFICQVVDSSQLRRQLLDLHACVVHVLFRELQSSNKEGGL